MEIVILSFTDAGCQMACKVRENFIQSGYRVEVYTLTRFCRLYGFHAFPEDKKSWIGSLWGEKALLFIGRRNRSADDRLLREGQIYRFAGSGDG